MTNRAAGRTVVMKKEGRIIPVDHLVTRSVRVVLGGKTERLVDEDILYKTGQGDTIMIGAVGGDWGDADT